MAKFYAGCHSWRKDRLGKLNACAPAKSVCSFIQIIFTMIIWRDDETPVWKCCIIFKIVFVIHYAVSLVTKFVRVPVCFQIIVNLYATRTSPKWKDPAVFRPERFLDTNGHLINKNKVISFSLGQSFHCYNCIIKWFGAFSWTRVCEIG